MDAKDRFFARRRLTQRLKLQELVLANLQQQAGALDHEIVVVSWALSQTEAELEAFDAKKPKRKGKR